MIINRRNSPLFCIGKTKWEQFVSAYSGRYDFSESVYAGMNQKVTFQCPTHGLVQSDAKILMNGAICQQCAFEARKGKLRMTQKQMLDRFTNVHGDTYNYDAAKYAGQQTPISIGCAEHGAFWQRPEYHWGGSGCPTCFEEHGRGGAQRDTLESFSAKVQAVFGSAFDMSGVVYKHSQSEITIRCVLHNRMCTTRPNRLLSGNNPCTKCNHMKSKGEEAIRELVSNYTLTEARNRTLLAPKEVDIYMPDRKLAIEYSGMYWHSHFNAADEKSDKRKHVQKYVDCKAKGIRLLTIYETEWETRPYAIKRLLRNACGKAKGKLMARKCDLRTVPTAEARAFSERYHPQGGTGGGEHYGLYWKEKLVACMRFAFGSNDRGAGAKKSVWTLGRYATRITVAGAASRLFKAFLKVHGEVEVKSFSDNRYFEGGMYEQLGFVLEEEVSIDYQVWSPKKGLLPKPHYQRRTLPQRLLDHGMTESFDPTTDPRTEAEMTYLMKCGRIYDCGKKRWLYTPSKVV